MKAKLKRIGAAILAAITSKDAIKAEKNLAVFLATRIALSLGASAGLVALIAKL